MLVVKNKKATRNYEIVDKYMAGVVLTGYEVKALRETKANFEGSYIKIVEDEAVLVGTHIGRYSKTSQDPEKINPKRDRKLLLNRREIDKIKSALNEKGKSAVPLAFVLQHNLVKLELAVVKGRKKHEKKHLEKERQIKKDLDKFNSEIRRSI